MKFYFITLVSIFLFSCNKITNKEEEKTNIYLQKSIEFIKQINNNKFENKKFILVDKPFDFKDYDCIESVLKDTITFSKKELLYIEKVSKSKSIIPKWTSDNFKNFKIISNDSINLIFSDYSKGWEYYYKNVGDNFNEFSVPIFIRNDTYCLFYSSNSSGGLSGHGSLILYKKEKDIWKEVKSYCFWIS